jgi:tetratricopeptide (TPR) repeat protein
MGLDPHNILANGLLTKSEQIAFDHFKKNPSGRGFFAVAEIMAKHQDHEEAIQLLTSGLQRHPGYSVARVYLSSLLLRRGNLVEAWENLEQSPLPLRGNLTAQVIRLKLSLLLGQKDEALDLAKDLKIQDLQEAEVKSILIGLEVKPFAEVRRDFAEHMKLDLGNVSASSSARKDTSSLSKGPSSLPAKP